MLLDLNAIAARCNELLAHDGFRFVLLADRLYLRDLESRREGLDNSDTEVDPLQALGTMESLTPEGRKYAIPFALIG